MLFLKVLSNKNMDSIKGTIVKDEYAYRVQKMSLENYQILDKKSKFCNVVFSPVFMNKDKNSIDMATWYFGKKSDLDNFLTSIKE